jgi:hypothetical protein
VKQGRGNIEDFLKKKLDNLENQFQGDWDVFEQKLERALFLKQLRRLAFMGGFGVLLTAAFLGSNYYTYNQYNEASTNYYEARTMPISTLSTSYVTEPTEIAAQQTIEPQQKDRTEVEKVIEPAVNTTSISAEVPVQVEEAVASASLSASINPIIATGDDEQIDEAEDVMDDELFVDTESIIDLAKKPLYSMLPRYNARSLQQSKDDDYVLDLGAKKSEFAFAPMVLKAPIPITNISVADNGPYVSPLQEKSPWSYSLNVYPNFTFREFKVDEDQASFIHRDFVDVVEVAESGGFSLNIGFEISRRVGKITYLNGGIEYISNTVNADFNFTNFRDANINPATGEILSYTLKEETEQISFSDENKYHYINIPLSVSYQPWATDHIRLNMEVGGSLLYFASASGSSLDYKTLERIDISEREYRKYMGSFTLKVGANYFVSERINIGFEPTLVYFTNTIYTQDYPFYVIPYSVGLNLNLQVKLN